MPSNRQPSKSTRAKRTPSATKRAKRGTKGLADMVSLSAATRFFIIPKSGNPPGRALLLYHLSTGALRPDKRVQLTGQSAYGFKRSTLQAFARQQGWQYVAPK